MSIAPTALFSLALLACGLLQVHGQGFEVGVRQDRPGKRRHLLLWPSSYRFRIAHQGAKPRSVMWSVAAIG
jgi:hypothetical protein